MTYRVFVGRIVICNAPVKRHHVTRAGVQGRVERRNEAASNITSIVKTLYNVNDNTSRIIEE